MTRVPFPKMKYPLVAILRGLKPEETPATIDTLLEAGFRAIEIPLNSPEPFKSIEIAAKMAPADALIGAGTVLTKADVKDPATPSITLLEIVAKTNLVPSKSEGRRLIVQGGVEIDEQKQIDPNAVVSLVPGRRYRLRVGRRKFAIAEYHS